MAFYRITQPFNPGGRGTKQFTCRFEAPVSLTGAEIQSIANAWATESNTHVPTLFCGDIAWGSAEAAQYELVTPPGWNPATPAPPFPFFRDVTVVTLSTVAPTAGLVAGQSSPPQIALVVSFGTGLAGRRNRGRVYTPNMPELVVDGSGAVTNAAARRDWIQQCCEAVEAAIIPVDIDHVVHSAWYNSHTDVTTYTANATADTQRRRARV